MTDFMSFTRVSLALQTGGVAVIPAPTEFAARLEENPVALRVWRELVSATVLSAKAKRGSHAELATGAQITILSLILAQSLGHASAYWTYAAREAEPMQIVAGK